MIYGYDDLTRGLEGVGGVFSIGKSVFGRDILAVIAGIGEPRTLIHGGIHARESVTSAVVMKMLENHRGAAICFVPMVNPDGAMLIKYGADSAPAEYRQRLIDINGKRDFSLWKANGRAVDINVNFKAGWGQGLSNVRYPASESYIGPFSESEPETRALTELTEKYKFTSSLSLHTKGGVIYYGYKQTKSYYEYAVRISSATGFPLVRSVGSSGGYKDWFLLKGYGIGLTLELGSDSLRHPIGLERLDEIYFNVREVSGIAAEIGEELWMKNL